MNITKRLAGRPPTGRTVQRYQVTLPPAVQKQVRKYGKGSLSRGIIMLAAFGEVMIDPRD